MVEYTLLYTNKTERTTAIANAESQGHQMIRDEFTLGPNGEHQLTFEDSPVNNITTLSPREQELSLLRDSIKNRTVTMTDIIRYLELRDRLV